MVPNWFHVKLLLLILCPFLSWSQVSNSIFLIPTTLSSIPQPKQDIKTFLSTFPELKSASSSVKEWFYWTNYSRRYPKAFWDSAVAPILKIQPKLNTSFAVSLKKELYKDNQLPFVMPNPTLMRLAQLHSGDLAKAGGLSHSSSKGIPFERRVFNAGITKCAAENLSLGTSSPLLALVLLYLDQGIPELGHRNNLLNAFYVEMGVGITKTKNNQFVTVQDFACAQN